jgi:hypothetical protein
LSRFSADVSFSSSANSNRPSSFILALSLAEVLLVWSFSYVVGKIALRHIDALLLAVLRRL